MSTYKLIQDVEAEDKILGPLTLRQFIFALIAVFMAYLCVFVTTRGLPFLLVVFLPPTLFFGFFALPFGRDQPTEVWALAKLRYMFKPRLRIWNQSGVKELVTINVPKRVERVLTNGLNQGEVESRLKALANTLDSRGWAIKNAAPSVYTSPQFLQPQTDRLIDIGTIPQQVPETSIAPDDDVLDNEYSPIAQQFNVRLDESALARRQQIVDQMNEVEADGSVPPGQSKQDDYWFMNNPQVPAGSARAAASGQADEDAINSQLRANAASHPTPYGNLRTLNVGAGSTTDGGGQGASTPMAPVTATPDPAILSLANNDDLNVSTLAHEAGRIRDDENDKDEVTISLH